MSKLIIANWKMNPASVDEAVNLAKAIDSESLVIAPPFVFAEAVSRVIKKAALGSQDLFWEDVGAFTGEISASQLKNLGVTYAIVGHSERRRHLGETDEMVAKKMAVALRNGLIPILCVGETRAERDRGQTQKVVERQLKKDLPLVASGYTLNPIIIAYEPVWAIGTDNSDTPENIIEIAKLIRKTLVAKIIYGGSVTAKNAESFFKNKEVDGALVGGASLKADEMKKILLIAGRY